MNTSAFTYLIARSYANQAKTRLKRMRQPRYALGLLAGVAYMWYFLIRQSHESGAVFASFATDNGRLIAVAGLFVMTLSAWLAGSDLLALAFSKPEVAFLFPAPVSRRSLVGYKLFRAQLAILLNTLIWVLIMRRGGTLGPVPRALGMWVLFTTLNFHRLVAALVRTAVSEHGGQGAKRVRGSIAVFAAAVIAIGVSVVKQWPALSAVRGMALLEAIKAALASEPAAWVLWPFRALVAPALASTRAEWGAAMPMAVVILLLHAWWVLRTDTAFEEAALAASEERAARIKQFKETRGWRWRRTRTRTGGVAVRLASTGHPAAAIVWKNALCLRRTVGLSEFLPLLIPGIVMGISFTMVGESGHVSAAAAVAGMGAMFTLLLLFFGGRIVRNDLRHDMLHIVALKTLPMSGHVIVAAEVLSAAIPIAIMQLASLAVAAIAATFIRQGTTVAPLDALLVWIGAVPTLLAYNIASLTLQNAAPVLFPSWSRLGATVSPGLESLGQNLLSVGLILFLLAVLLVVPVTGGGALWYFLLEAAGALGILVALIVGSALLGIEANVLMYFFGRAFEKTEPSQVA